ncbi:MAG: ArsR/SmtB family transcription factor [Actinomycetota bacterium]
MSVHVVDADRVAVARAAVPPRAQVDRAVAALALLADPTRLRVLRAVRGAGELCVGDLAVALGTSADAVGYALRMLRTSGLVHTRRAGRLVYYRLADGFPEALLDDCVHRLFHLVARGAERPAP